MPTSFIYHALSLRYLNYKRIFLKNGKVFFAVETKPKSIKCPQCNNKNVVKRGKIVRELKSLPIGARNTRIQANIQKI
jgi:transposase